MTSYPPSSSKTPYRPAEEYELSTSPVSGPSTNARPSLSRNRRTSGSRTVTLHPNQSTNLLFAAPGTSSSPQAAAAAAASTASARRAKRRTSSSATAATLGLSPKLSRSHFLTDDLDNLGPDEEEVHVPDFGHMLGIGTDAPHEDHYKIAGHMSSSWKRRLYLLLEEPSSGGDAFFIHVLVTGAIIFSAILTTLSTLPEFHTDPAAVKTLFGLDTTIVILFTFEYIARAVAHSDSWQMYYRWTTSFFAIVDLLAILPYYVEVARQDDTTILFRFSILRTFRLLRVFRAFRYQNSMLMTMEVMYVAIRRSKEALVAISYFIILILVLFSTLIYFAERGTWDGALEAFVNPDGDVSQFDSIPAAAWYSLVTMSTAGYGDIVPKTALGKLLSVPLLMFGLLLIALPSFVLGRNFAIVYDAMISAANHNPPHSTEEGSRAPSPMPSDVAGGGADETSEPLLPVSAPRAGSGSQFDKGERLKMWDPASQGLPPPPPPIERMSTKDITNTKLAKNQYVLLEQIDSLRRTVEKQSEMVEKQAEMLSKLMSALALKEDLELPGMPIDKGKGRDVSAYED